MNIPQVNATVTKKNREQTKRIMEILDDGTDPLFDYDLFQNSSCYGSAKIINGSFTLCQVVGMLEAEGVIYANHIWRFRNCCGWALPEGCACKILSHVEAEPHDLTAAMDARIKVLEAKP